MNVIFTFLKQNMDDTLHLNVHFLSFKYGWIRRLLGDSTGIAKLLSSDITILLCFSL